MLISFSEILVTRDEGSTVKAKVFKGKNETKSGSSSEGGHETKKSKIWTRLFY